MFCFYHPVFFTLSCSQLLGYGVVTLMHLERSHPSGGMDLGLVWGAPLDPTSRETIKSQVSLQMPAEGRVILAAGLRESLQPLAFPAWSPWWLRETRSCSPWLSKGRRHEASLELDPSAWVRGGEGR